MCLISNYIETSLIVYLIAFLQGASKHLLYGAFKAHFYRKHNASPPLNITVRTVAFKCIMALCERQCQDTKDLIAHLKEHISEGREVSCPVKECTRFHCQIFIYCPHVTET